MNAPVGNREDPVDRILAGVERHVRSGDGWSAVCPAHPDRRPSLSVKRGDNGQALVCCHAGCATEDVMAALGLRLADLYLDRKDRPANQWMVSGEPLNGRQPVTRTNGRTPTNRRQSAPAAGTGQRSEPAGDRTTAAEYAYRDERGVEVFRKVRRADKSFGYRRNTTAGVEYKLGDARRVLYRLPELLAAVQAGEPVYVVEGEKDVDRLADEGHTSTCNHDGAGKWDEDYNAHFAGAHVVIVADRDKPGYRHARAVLTNLSIYGGVGSVRVVEPATTAEHDDVSDHLDAGRTLDELVPIEPDELVRLAGETPAAPEGGDVPFEESERTTGWERTDLGPILDGTYEAPQPAVLHRTDGVGLFYPGLLHQVIGQPESGKSWLVLLAAAARLDAGQSVLFLDYESDPAQVVARLLALGAGRDALVRLFDYRRPEVGVDRAAGAFAELLTTRYGLVVVDGVTDAIGLAGGSITDNDETADWIRRVPERIARVTGAAVVLVDHVAKAAGAAPSRYAVGAQQKLGKIRGVSYYVEPRVPIAPGEIGELAVIGTKDTQGQVKRHGVALPGGRMWAAARVMIDAADPERLVVRILPPFEAVGSAVDVGVRGAAYERVPALMERVSRVLETAGEEISSTQAAKATKPFGGGRKELLLLALQALVREGYATRRASGVAQLHKSVTPFREAADPGVPAVVEAVREVDPVIAALASEVDLP